MALCAAARVSRRWLAGGGAVSLLHTANGYWRLYRGYLRLAEEALRRALAISPDYLPALQALALVAERQQDWPLAAQRWRGLLALDARAVRGLHGLALCQIERGEFAPAAATLRSLAAAGAAGRLRALKLRVVMAEKQLDERAVRAARRELGECFPQASKGLPAWLRPSADAEEAQDRLIAQLRRARDEQSARLLLNQLEPRLPRADCLALTRETAAAFPNAAGLHAHYIRLLAESLTDAGRLAEMQGCVRAFQARFPRHAQSWHLAALAAVAARDQAAVARLIEDGARKLGGHVRLDELRVWLTTMRGEHEEARRLARRLRERGYRFDEDGRGLDLRLANAAPARPLREKILLFSCFRNERAFAPWFLDYYRALGVEWFFIVDNLSTDKTVEYLTAQKDVTVFASGDHYLQTGSGARWVNELLRRYGEDNWCLHVDADEQLVLPMGGGGNDGGGGSPLRRLVDDMAARGEEALAAFMLDTYPDDLGCLPAAAQQQEGIDPAALSRMVDADIYFTGKSACGFFRARGGARERLFGTNEWLEKAPLLRGGRGVYYQHASHAISYARLGGRSGVLLHHKLLRELLEMRGGGESRQRVDHRDLACRLRHERYRQSGLLDRGRIPGSAMDFAYESPGQLAAQGFFGDLMNAS